MEQRQPKPMDKGGGMWPVERAMDYCASLVHRVRQLTSRGEVGVGDGDGGSRNPIP